jgi:hypothetical protein
MHKNTILLEKARGLLYRDAGDTFIQGPIDAPTATMSFVSATYYPSQPGQYETHDAMMLAAGNAEDDKPGVTWINQPIGNMRAFAVLELDGPEEGQKSYFGKFFQQIRPDMAGSWKNNEIPGGWQLTKKSSMKAAYGLKPTDLFPEDTTFMSGAELISALQKIEKIKPLFGGFVMLLNGDLPVFIGQGSMTDAIRDDLGEIIGPLALIKGMVTDAGAETAKKDLLQNGGWGGSSIKFPSSKTNGLVDSIITTPNGIEVGISSKGNKGATASIKNVADGIQVAEVQDTPAMKKLLKKYATQVELIKEISSRPARYFPTEYAVENGLIKPAQAQAIQKIIDSSAKSLDEIAWVSKADKKLFTDFISSRSAAIDKANYNIGLHILGALAYEVANAINSDKNFSKACIDFMNVTPIIQLYTNVKDKKGDATVTGFTSIYPPNFQGNILLDAGKVYSASGINGRYTFRYDPTGKASAVNSKQTAKATEKIQKAVEKDAGSAWTQLPKAKEKALATRTKRGDPPKVRGKR